MLCQQSFKAKCNAYNESLKEIHESAPEPAHNEPEVKDVYGSLLDDLNAKYERLLSLFQELLDSNSGIGADREVSQLLVTCFIMIRVVMVDGRKPCLEFECALNWPQSAKIFALSEN